MKSLGAFWWETMFKLALIMVAVGGGGVDVCTQVSADTIGWLQEIA
jgi:hypothetical protein